MRFRVLGTLEIVDGRAASATSAALGSARLRRLLAVLLVHAGSVVSVDRLADVVWGDAPPVNPEAAVHTLVSRLRTALRASAGDSADAGTLLTRAPGYLLQVPRDAVDAARFEELVAQARASAAAAPQRAVETLDAALALWRGAAYAEFADEDFARAEASRLDELRTAAREDRAALILDLGACAEAIPWLEALVTAHPLRERPHAQLMLALYRAGRQADALGVYRDYRQRLDEELGLEPSAALQRLQSEVLRQDPALDWSTPRGSVELAPPPPSAGNLPPTLPDLVGRDDTVARVLDSLPTARVVTLIGPGGVGKTSVALHVAVRAAGHADGAWLCELAAVSEPGAVADAVASALSVQQRQGLTAVERLVEYLRPKRLLLVLDNCEHVLDAAARLVDAVARGCPAVTVLTTSREPLGVNGEHVRSVPPLAVPPAGPVDVARAEQTPAVALFLARARAATPEFVLSDTNAAAVAEICRRLDGLPLAIELAATRMRSMTAAEVVDRLGTRFHFLRSASRIAEQRHRTLRAVVDWSYQLLSETEQRVFDRLSVFAGSFPLHAAAHVIDGIEGDAADLLAGLVDKSLLVATNDGTATRYALLDTLRAYGRERLLARHESAAVQRTHAEFHTAFVETADAGLAGPEHARWADAIARTLDDLRTAHAWALEADLDLAVRLVAGLFRFVEHRMVSEITIWAERTVQAAEGVSRWSSLLPAVYGVAASGARFRGDLARARALAERGIALGAGADQAVRARPLFVLGDVSLFEGRLADAERLYEETERVAAQAGEAGFAAYARSGRLVAAAYSADPTTVAALADEACAWVDRAGDPVASAWVRYAAGEARLDIDPDRAVALLDDAIARARALGERYLTGVALVSAASLRARHGDPHRAVPQFRDVLEHWHQAGNWTQQWTTMRNVVELLVRTRVDEPAAVLYGAVTSRPTAAPVFGADAHRLDEARRVLADRLGTERFAAAVTRGCALGDDDVVGFACATLDTAQLATPIGGAAPRPRSGLA